MSYENRVALMVQVTDYKSLAPIPLWISNPSRDFGFFLTKKVSCKLMDDQWYLS
jgi:hypothetical protein